MLVTMSNKELHRLPVMPLLKSACAAVMPPLSWISQNVRYNV